MVDQNEDSVDMDELSKSEKELAEDTPIEEDADKEPDSEILSTDDEEIDEVESSDEDDD